MVKVSDKPWSSVSDSDYTDEQFKKAALLPGEGKSDSKFPVYFPDGTLSRAAVHNAAARLNQASLSSEDKAKLKKKLRSLYSQIGEDPPDVLKDSETAYQTPYDDTEAVELGQTLMRKQVLPLRSINYEGNTLSFDKETVKKIADSFTRRPFEYVPFHVSGKHTDDPTQNGGEIIGLEATDDGLDALVQLNDAGKDAVERHNNKLPVSIRYHENYVRESDGTEFGPTLEHAASTYKPRMYGMRPWQPVEASEGSGRLVDLSEYGFADLEDSEASDGLSAEEQAAVEEVEREVADEADDGTPEEEETTDDSSEEDDMADMPKEGEKIQFKRGGATHEGAFKRVEGEGDSQVAIVEVDGDEVKVPVSMLQKGSGSGEDKEEPKDNSEGGSGLDLAELEARDRRIADLEAKLERSSESERRNTLELRRQKVERELEDYGRAGVPAADLALARPLLMDDDSGVELSYTDLSEDGAEEKKAARGNLVRKMLDSRKGTVEFGEKGDASAPLSEGDAKDKKIREYAAEHEMSYGEAARYVS